MDLEKDKPASNSAAPATTSSASRRNFGKFFSYASTQFREFDTYGEHFTMNLEKDKSYVRTYTGSLLTIIMLFITVAYTFQKIDVFIEKKDVDIMTSTMISYIDETQVFDHSQGLRLAMAFTAFDNDPEPILDKSIGELVFKAYSWGQDE